MQTLYRSPRDPKGQTITASQAVLQGLSPDGGLYVPTSIPEIDLDLNELKDLSYQDLAYKILRPLFSDYTDEELRSCIDKAYGDQWDTQEIAPVDYHADNAYLELFHGPTIAFKDVALQLLPHLMTVAAKKNGSD
ncbi:MAG: threonine synthase, partial [Lactobacillus ruminis]|nr:threonine synthase [Ligilactobacillus ruminis]